MILDPGYLESLNKPNVSLNWNGIERFTETGIRTKTGDDIACDAIIYGTGFNIVGLPFVRIH
jgi:cation diffusion facilitator CzcD-associated flavoprotein CzcO